MWLEKEKLLEIAKKIYDVRQEIALNDAEIERLSPPSTPEER